ncbi:MAG: 7-carboxy-7-deazaguanine synthase [Saprospiraceae bacterium]
MKTYSIKEIFYSLQGEGRQSGRPSVFLRFAGCNFWTGREEDRANAICNFCDTEFVGTDGTFGGKYKSASELVKVIADLWPDLSMGKPYVVCTGGEPLLQLDNELIAELHKANFEVAVETNGSIEAVDGIDWICMSPKTNDNIKMEKGDELKFVFPQEKISPEQFEHLSFKYFFIQPMDGPNLQENIQLAIRYCLDHPQWRLSLQNHKILGLR